MPLPQKTYLPSEVVRKPKITTLEEESFRDIPSDLLGVPDLWEKAEIEEWMGRFLEYKPDIIALQQRTPRYYDRFWAKEELGQDIPEGWQIAVYPSAEGETPRYEYITDDGWRVTSTGEYISPEGRRMTFEELLAMPEGQWPESLVTKTEAQATGRIPDDVLQQLRRDNPGFSFPNGMTYADLDRMIASQQAGIEAQKRAIGAVFTISDKDIDNILTWLGKDDANLDTFLGMIRRVGQTPETTALLMQMGAAKADVPEFFGLAAPAAPKYIPESKVKDIWDAFYLSMVRGFQSVKQTMASILPATLKLETEYEFWPGISLPKYTGEAGKARQEENRQKAMELMSAYEQRETEHQIWLEARPALQPRPEWIVDTENLGVMATFEKYRETIAADPSYILYSMAENASTVLAFAATIGIAYGTKNPKLTQLVAMTMFSPLEIHSLYEDLIANGAPMEEALPVALRGGALIGAMEGIGAVPIIKVINPVFMTAFKKTLVGLTARAIAKRLIVEGGKQAGYIWFNEVVIEELSQEIVHNAFVKTYNENRGLLENLPETFIRASISMLPMALGGGVMHYRYLKSHLSPDTQKTIDDMAQKLKEAGVPKDQAETLAFAKALEDAKVQAEVKAVTDDILKQTGLPTVINKAAWDIAPAVQRANWATLAGLPSNIRSKAWTDLTSLEIKALSSVKLPAVPPTAVPKAPPGTDIGIQKGMLGGDKLVIAEGKGKVVQADLLQYGKLEEMRRQAEGIGYEASEELASLTEYLASDALANARFNLGGKSVGIDAFISIREQSFPEYLTVKQAEALFPGHDFVNLTPEGRVPRDAALDDLTKRFNMSADEIATRAEQIRQYKNTIKDLKREVSLGVGEPEVTPPTPVVPKPTIIEQMQQLRADIANDIKAMQFAIEGMTGDEIIASREFLSGMERELKYADRILTGFRKRPDLPDAYKLRSTIEAWARYKGLPKIEVQRITQRVTGRSSLKNLTQEKLIDVLAEVKKTRPKTIRGSTVITQETEDKIKSLKDALAKGGLIDDAAYKQIMQNVGITSDRYISQYRFVTESKAKEFIRTLNDEAIIGYRAEQTADIKALDRNPAIKAVIDDYDKRIAKQGAAYFRGKPADASILEDMRYFTGDLEVKTGKPFYHYWNRANVQAKVNSYVHKQTLKELFNCTPDCGKIRNNKAALNRVSDYIAAKNKWLNVKSPADITKSEIVLANKIEELLLRVVPDYRYHRFMQFYHEMEGNVEFIQKNIPDAPRKDIEVAIDILESRGAIALKTYLDTRTWGVIESGFEPHFVVNPKLAMKRLTRVAFPTGRFQARTGVEFTPVDKDIVSRAETYLRQIQGFNLRPYIRGLERIYGDAIPQLKNPGKVNKAISSSLNEMMGYIEEGGMMYRVLVKFASQAYTTIFSTYPHLPFRNLLQNAVMQVDRSILIDPRNKPLTPQDKLYSDIFVSQMSDIPRDLMLSEAGGLPGFGRVNKFLVRLNVYGKSDSSFNRPWSMWGNINKADRALKTYLKNGDVKEFVNNSGMNELNLAQQQDILKKLARKIYDYKVEGLAPIDGGHAAIRETAREITENVHFLYTRWERGAIEMGGMGRIVGSLMVFARGYAQRMVIHINRLRPGSQATGAMKRHSMKVIIGNIIAGQVVGFLFQKMTGKKRNPYNPLNIISWSPGGIPVGVVVDLAQTMGDLFQAVQGDKAALGRMPTNLTRLGDTFIVFYSAIMNLLESLTDKKFIDREALRKLRELLDKTYTVNESFYEKERSVWGAFVHAMWGGEIEGYKVPPNPEIDRIQRQYSDLFDLYDAYGNEDSHRYIEDDDERKAARRKLYTDNPGFADDRRRLEMYKLGVGDDKVIEAYKELTWWQQFIIDFPVIGEWYRPKRNVAEDTALVESYVEYGRIVDKFGANSPEALMYRYEHSGLEVFGEDPDTFDWNELTPSEQDVKKWLLQIANGDLIDLKKSYADKHSDNFIKDDDARQKAYESLYNQNPGFKDDERRIDAYGKEIPSNLVENYVEYYNLPAKGYDQERYLQEHQDFYDSVWLGILDNEPIDFDKIPSREIESLLTEYDSVEQGKDRLIFRHEHPELDDWGVATGKWSSLVGDRWMDGKEDKKLSGATGELGEPVETVLGKYAKDITEYRGIPLAGYGNERYLQEHPDFYKDVWLGEWGNQEVNFGKIPTPEVEKLYKIYQGLPVGTPRLNYRAKHPDLDAWLVKAFGYKSVVGRGDEQAKKTAWEEIAEAEALRDWIQSLMP